MNEARCPRRHRGVSLLAVFTAVVIIMTGEIAHAFPPYHSTDAETAESGTIESRLGLVSVEHDRGNIHYASPLLHLNIGLAQNVEIPTEWEYLPDEGSIGDVAVGIKFATDPARFSIGMENLALLPLAPHQSGLGLESQLLATYRMERHLLHLNAGGFYDPRGDETERGWRLGLLVEKQQLKFRHGLELFLRQIHGQPVAAQLGWGIITPIPKHELEMRFGIHAGLTREAPDIETSFWLTWKWRLQ